MLHKNGEGYPDPTAGDAIREADKPPEHVRWFCRTVKEIASLIGLEVTGRIQVIDRQVGSTDKISRAKQPGNKKPKERTYVRK